MVKTGWVVFIAAFGMMCGLLAVDISQLMSWEQGIKPAFVGNMLGHVAVVITAFVGGRLVPNGRSS